MALIDITMFPKFVALVKRKTPLSLSDQQRADPAERGRLWKRDVNNLDYHNRPAEWIGTSRSIHARPGAAFGQPTEATSTGVYWKNKRGQNPSWLADTQPKRKTFNATKAGTPPNPGRPQLGGSVPDQ